MKKTLMIILALLLAAFTAEASGEVEVIENETKKEEKKGEGRILHQVMNLNDVVYEFVDSYVREEVGTDYDFRMDSACYSEEDQAILYAFNVFDQCTDPEHVDYILEVYAAPTKGVGHVVLYHK